MILDFLKGVITLGLITRIPLGGTGLLMTMMSEVPVRVQGDQSG